MKIDLPESIAQEILTACARERKAWQRLSRRGHDVTEEQARHMEDVLRARKGDCAAYLTVDVYRAIQRALKQRFEDEAFSKTMGAISGDDR